MPKESLLYAPSLLAISVASIWFLLSSRALFPRTSLGWSTNLLVFQGVLHGIMASRMLLICEKAQGEYIENVQYSVNKSLDRPNIICYLNFWVSADTCGHPTLASPLTCTHAGGTIQCILHPYHSSHVPSANGTRVDIRVTPTCVTPPQYRNILIDTFANL
ncbi:hypothetical protein BD769DRAFT_1475426 [Suillus cothurnatus]|nr:hypothetical protein BD769DRAFT_1546942 [Suillus cothurnatus]KAG2122437.1 hypothetical protein BD769DRAFT_1475426 [Suillus cothurnatus]